MSANEPYRPTTEYPPPAQVLHQPGPRLQPRPHLPQPPGPVLLLHAAAPAHARRFGRSSGQTLRGSTPSRITSRAWGPTADIGGRFMQGLCTGLEVVGQTCRFIICCGSTKGLLARFPSRAKRIDVIARFVFPLIFAIFNLAYWLYYLFAKTKSFGDG